MHFKKTRFLKGILLISITTAISVAAFWTFSAKYDSKYDSLAPIPIPVSGTVSDMIDLSIITPRGRPKVDVFMNILVAGHLLTRRNVIRNTWLSTAQNYSIAYRFFTDGIGLEPELMDKLKEEQEQYKDLELLPTKRGYWFSHRYLFAMFWAYQRYDFQFFVRVDDDYFVCLNNLMNDLENRRHEKLLYWGWFGCDYKMVAMDEGFLLTSVDLIQEVIRRNNSLYCHPMGGQMIAMWVNRLENEGLKVTYFPDNTRIVHYRSHITEKQSINMCKDIIGIHQSYPIHMEQFWNLTRDNWFSLKSDEFLRVERKEYKHYCKQPKGWDWRVLDSHWKHEPKPCWEPGLSWPELEKYKEHKGREVEEKEQEFIDVPKHYRDWLRILSEALPEESIVPRTDQFRI